MAMLTSGEYSLIKKNGVQERKSIYFLKLTESAQRALDTYLHNPGLNPDDKPQIEFNDKNEGRILIPTKTNKSDKCVAQFKFDVSSNYAMQGMQGRLDCVQHKRNTKQLIKLGQLAQRLRIHATEDVYETTKNRMAAIELEQRKNCTRQLDWDPTHTNRKAKLEKLGKLSTTSTPSSKSEDTKSASCELSNAVRSKTRSVYNPPQKLNTNVYKMRKPLRERLVQMLAVRPYKKGELQAVLKQEGLRECDKPSLTDTLNSVSTLRDNVYHLAKSAWNDVQEDWIFYTEQEKQVVRKNKLRNLTSPSSSDSGISTSSSQSPGNTPDEKSPPSNYKRPGYINGIDGFPTKRQRISHFKRQESAITSTKTSSASTCDENNALRYDDCLRPSSERSPSVRNQQRSSTAPALPISDYTSGESNSYSTHRKDTPPPIVSSTTPDDDSPRNENSLEDDINEVSSTRPVSSFSATTYPAPAPAPTNNHDRDSQFRKFVKQESFIQPALDQRYVREKPKYMKEYVTIVNVEQRRKYKTDFNEIFKEYQRVHEEVDSISNEFAQLGESLRQHKKGTPKYNRIESEIFKKYFDLKKNSNFTAAKRRFEYLHEKLSHIKQLVHEFDVKNNVQQLYPRM